MMEPKKKIFGPIEIFAFLATSAILAYLAFNGGCEGVLERTENVEIVDNAPYVGGEKKVRSYRPNQEESVEAILQQMADGYISGKRPRSSKKQLEEAGMSEDELDFLESVKEKKVQEQKAKAQTDESIDWFSVLRSSHKTYSKVKSVFKEAGIDVEFAEDNVTSKLVNEVAARSVYNKMEKMFGIPAEDTKAFADKGEKALSDWAEFVNDQTDK